jgi:Flagellar hook capping protein
MDTSIGLNSTGILTKQEYDESQLVRESGDDDLDRNAFLTLLTTQLQNQNPLDPMKNEAFVAQLAQFSQLEGITNMSTSLDEVANVMRPIGYIATITL